MFITGKTTGSATLSAASHLPVSLGLIFVICESWRMNLVYLYGLGVYSSNNLSENRFVVARGWDGEYDG